MQSNKIVRFLNSIKLNPSHFLDLEFDAIYKSDSNPNLWVMMFVKDNYFTYEKYKEFKNGLRNINYPYDISFSYRNELKFEDIYSFFNAWYLDVYKTSFLSKLKYENNTLTFLFLNVEEKNKNQEVINCFKDVINFLSIQIEIVLFPDQDIVLEEKIQTNSAAIKDGHEMRLIEENNIMYEELIQNVGNEILDNLESNMEKMKKDRENFLKYKRGNYKYFENYFDIPKNEITHVDIDGEIYQIEIKDSRKNGKKFIIGGIGKDNKCAISFRAFEDKNLTISLFKELLKNAHEEPIIMTNVRIRGVSSLDERTGELLITAHYIDVLPKKTEREDLEPQKRVELHLHTTMSSFDGVTDIADYISLAKKMGHKAIAVTDHGVVQAFPNAQNAAKNDIKVLYGCELYMVDKKLNYTFNNKDVPLKGATYVCLDLETTGLSATYDRIIEFGAVKIGGITNERVDMLINPEVKLFSGTTALTHITDDMLADKPTFKECYQKILDFLKGAIIVTHNTAFDITFLNGELERLGLPYLDNPVIDTLSLSRYLFTDSRSHTLESLSKRLELSIYDDDKAHRADFDAEVLANVWVKILNQFLKENPNMLHSDLSKLDPGDEIYKHLRPSHMCVIAKNKQGFKDLYKLISNSHINCFADVPKAPREEIVKIRENLLIGSGCLNGEIFEIAHTKTRRLLKDAMKFYDYVEIQPLDVYRSLVYKYKYSKTDSLTGTRKATLMSELRDDGEIIRTIKDIISIADELGIPVCATGDVHYLNKEDKKIREIMIATDGLGHRAHPLCTNPRGAVTDHQNIYRESGDQYYRNTKEMLDEFSYLDEAKRKEIVITNTNKIADMCEVIMPISPGLHTPTIENVDVLLKDAAYTKAKELYGDPLPEEITSRLNREFSRIKSEKGDFSVNYILAKRIIEKAEKDGSFVGSRGSVGSSFVAYLVGVTEVNPLPAHYLCPHCKHLEFGDANKYLSGVDMDSKDCPICGTKMIRDGQNIPFETFLGFNSKTNKVPDIDLNFSEDYQQKAHDYVREMFGTEHVFRAGTIGTFQDKQAFAAVNEYVSRSLHLDPNTFPHDVKAYLAKKCVGIKRTTGRHAGGVILIPTEFDVHDFTPIQYPADKKDSNWFTTHFEYKKIHDSVLKLDLLGHRDPQALLMLQRLTGVPFRNIDLGDKKVLSLFRSNEELHLKSNFLKTKLGNLGLPEFGTPTTAAVLEEVSPSCFNDLLVVSGITHGEGVWAGNAQMLLEQKIAKSLNDVIGCRDDIMTTLLNKGIETSVAFNVMEDVRKGRGVKQEYAEIMRQHEIPDYYIASCNKISYLFPRAHAVAYVTQAVRIAYYKLYYPLEHYATFLSIRATKFDIYALNQGYEGVKARYIDLMDKRKKEKKLKVGDEELVDSLKISIEMYERGFGFLNIDLNRSLASDFNIDYEKKALIPPFSSLDGLGENVGQRIVDARNEKPFTSIEDFAKRSGVNQTLVGKLRELGVLSNLKENDEISLFDDLY